MKTMPVNCRNYLPLGKATDSLYTEDDVIAAARVLTGWRINDDPLDSYFDAGAHDTGSKTFSAFYNNTTISWQQQW